MACDARSPRLCGNAVAYCKGWPPVVVVVVVLLHGRWSPATSWALQVVPVVPVFDWLSIYNATG